MIRSGVEIDNWRISAGQSECLRAETGKVHDSMAGRNGKSQAANLRISFEARGILL